MQNRHHDMSQEQFRPTDVRLLQLGASKGRSTCQSLVPSEMQRSLEAENVAFEGRYRSRMLQIGPPMLNSSTRSQSHPEA